MSRGRHLLIVAIIIFISIIFVGCKDKDFTSNDTPSCDANKQQIVHEKENVVVASKEEVNENENGNTNGNLNNFGLAVEKKGWIYYLYEKDDKGYIYKKKIDGSSNTKLCDDYGFYINVVGNYIYYNNADDNNHIYRIKTDGTGREKISNDVVQDVYVEGKFIYYVNAEDGKIYKLKIDNKEKVKLSDDIIETGGIVIDKEFIYYNNKGITKIKKDGSAKTSILQDNSNVFTIIDVDQQWMYYLNDVGLFRIKKDGTLKEQLYSGSASWGNVKGEYIFFSDINDGCIYKLSKDGKSKTKVVEDLAYKINIIGNEIYYDYSNRPMKMKWISQK